MTPLNKGIILVSTLGALGGAGAYAGGLFNSNTQITDNPKTNIDTGSTIVQTNVSDKLRTEGFDVLDTSATSTDWTTVLEDYKKATTKTFDGVEKNSVDDKALRDKCKVILGLKDSEDYAKAKMWCVKKQKMNEVLKKAGFKVLGSANEVIQEEVDIWKQKISTWKTATSKPFNSALTGKIKDTSADDNENIRLFRAECEKLKITALDTTSTEFETNFELAREWCSVKEG
ncbi:hypothetical protein A6V39_03780 [Candidatus Mycoplasma haematobovis]|uniref:Uncharacterized protein n=1 Tax=Candidatus Mycoplasma haematobovis TaxID=432608 RepID=A0A1A9QC19_9MOLU|nr:hypothetical protein [Candidatus Mycoplasma haematobovis]OAL10007.1 hypothetical protein A6V39_03780 [Candidatus Mycoplasma haematobovis]